MNRLKQAIALLGICACLPASGQEQAGAAHVYEAYFRVAYADLETWNEYYWEYSVPVLTELQQDGVIEGFGQWQHHSGGDYNIRFIARTYDWASIETFWREYLAGLDEAMPAAMRAAYDEMIIEHRDEIWNIGRVNVPAGFEPSHIYSSLFTVNFSDMEEWIALWDTDVAPIFEQAMADGLLGGWVRLDHNTGGPFNTKFFLMVDDWDKIDDVVFARMMGGLMADKPEQWARLNALFDRHDDIIWEPTTREQ